jgi:putative transposase
VEIVRKAKGRRGFAVMPWRWIVERTFTWLGRYRRLKSDYERLPETTEAIIHIAMIRLMVPPAGWLTMLFKRALSLRLAFILIIDVTRSYATALEAAFNRFRDSKYVGLLRTHSGRRGRLALIWTRSTDPLLHEFPR